MGLRLTARETLCRLRVPKITDRLLPRYRYNFTPDQLVFLCSCLKRTRRLTGPVVEIGCAAGNTTIFLNLYLRSLGQLRPYICIDTFGGFTEQDIRHEVESRGKTETRQFRAAWRDWSKELFKETLRFNKIDSATVIQADVNTFDFTRIDRPSFCLIDVDLYRPVKSALEGVYQRMQPGGVIVVDDLWTNHKYDGARQAYEEFVRQRKLPERTLLRKLGVIRIPRESVGCAVASSGRSAA